MMRENMARLGEGQASTIMEGLANCWPTCRLFNQCSALQPLLANILRLGSLDVALALGLRMVWGTGIDMCTWRGKWCEVGDQASRPELQSMCADIPETEQQT